MTKAAELAARRLARRYNAPEFGGFWIEDNSFFFPSITDTSEPAHRADVIGGRVYCTCRGYLVRKSCEHIDIVREEMANEETTAVAVREDIAPALSRHNPQELSLRLADMKQNRNLTQQFFRDVMVKGVDYGTIPGTDKPTLLKPGAEGLCELYGYAPTIKHVEETKDWGSGFLRSVVTIALVQRGSGEVVAEGIGECNTREARYFYRWIPEWEMRKLPDLWEVRSSFKTREGKKRNGEKFLSYRVENDDPYTLWNTVTKMAKKRALVDATLSATRSSGLFTQGEAGLDDWINADFDEIGDSEFEEAERKPFSDGDPGPQEPVQQPQQRSRATTTTTNDKPASSPSAQAEQPAEQRAEPAPGAAPTNVRNKIAIGLRDAAKSWSEPDYQKLLAELRVDYPSAFPDVGEQKLETLTADEANAIIRRLGIEGPPPGAAGLGI